MSHEELNKHKYEGNVDQILAMREKIEMDDILKEDTRFVIIEGAAGMGKSTLAWEICRSWDKLKSLKRFSLVIFVRLQEEEVQLAKDVSDLFYNSDRELSANVGREVEKRDGEGVLFVFDGFDEFPAEFRKKSLVMTIIGDPRYFRKAKVIVTSRPSALGDLQRFVNMKNSRHVEIIGFAKTEIMEYVSQRIAIAPNWNEALSKNFTSYLSRNPAVEGMMYNPLHCGIVLEIFLSPIGPGRPTIHTQTQLYNELALWLMSRHLGEEKGSTLPERLEDLRDETDLYQQLVKISKLAFEGVKSEQIIFKELPEGSSDLGLMIKKTEYYSRRRKTSEFIFFHYTLQEYMSAFYISHLNGEEQKSLYLHTSTSLKSVWVFVAGLTKMASIMWGEFTRGSLLNFPKKVDDFIIHCIYEAQDLYSYEIDAEGDINYLKLNPTNYDLFALGYSIRAFGGSWKVAVSGEVNEDGFEMLGLGIELADGQGGEVSPLTIEVGSQCSPCGTHIKQLLHMPDKILHSIKGLFLFNCSNNQKEDKRLLESKFRVCVESVTSFKIKNYKKDVLFNFYVPIWLLMQDVTVQHLNALKQISKGLSLPGAEPYDFNSEVVKFPEEQCMLVKNLMSLSSLESLVILDYFIPGSCGLDPFESVSDSIKFLQYTELLPKHYDYFDKIIPTRPQGVDILTNILKKKSSSLQHFKLYIVMTKDEVHDLVESLKENKNLEKLDLSRMYRYCFSEHEMNEMDHRVTFPASFVNFNHTQSTKEDEIKQQIKEEELRKELEKILPPLPIK